MFERFTDPARQVLVLANQRGQRFNHQHCGTEHILIGLVEEQSGVGATALKNVGVDLHKVLSEVEKIAKVGTEVPETKYLRPTPGAKGVIEYAIKESRNLGHGYVGTGHLLLGLLDEPDGSAAKVLRNLGLNKETIRESTLLLLNVGDESDRPTKPSEHP